MAVCGNILIIPIPDEELGAQLQVPLELPWPEGGLPRVGGRLANVGPRTSSALHYSLGLKKLIKWGHT